MSCRRPKARLLPLRRAPLRSPGLLIELVLVTEAEEIGNRLLDLLRLLLLSPCSGLLAGWRVLPGEIGSRLLDLLLRLLPWVLSSSRALVDEALLLRVTLEDRGLERRLLVSSRVLGALTGNLRLRLWLRVLRFSLGLLLAFMVLLLDLLLLIVWLDTLSS